MQTTLRLNDQLYREAKAEAARQGITLTRFLEEGLQLRLKKSPSKNAKPHPFPSYDSGKPFDLTAAQIKKVDHEEQERFYLNKVGLGKSGK